jgi:hypothetical protein
MPCWQRRDETQVLISIPNDKRDWFIINNNTVTSLKRDFENVQNAIKYCIFVPSHNRPTRARLEYETMGSSTDLQYRQIIVVQPNGDDGEGDFFNYQSEWGNRKVIICLPKVNIAGVHVKEGAVGFARNQIQHIANFFKLPAIFMLDDNILFFPQIPSWSRTQEMLHGRLFKNT